MSKTRKELSMDTLQKLVKKYAVTKSGSKKEIALRLWKLRHHVMSITELNRIEDFLNVKQSERYKGPRYGTRKNGSLYTF
jgi:hypothetical protein